MILTTLFFFLSFSLILAVVGYYTDVPITQIVGYTFIFLLAMQMFVSGVQYSSGENMTNNINGSGVITSTTTVTNYTTWQDATSNTISIYLALAAIICAIAVIFEMRDPKRLGGKHEE